MLLPIEQGQIEGAEVSIKVFVDELLIDAEVVGVGGTLGLDAGLERDKVESVRDVFAGADQHVTRVLHPQDLKHKEHQYSIKHSSVERRFGDMCHHLLRRYENIFVILIVIATYATFKPQQYVWRCHAARMKGVLLLSAHFQFVNRSRRSPGASGI